MYTGAQARAASLSSANSAITLGTTHLIWSRRVLLTSIVSLAPRRSNSSRSWWQVPRSRSRRSQLVTHMLACSRPALHQVAETSNLGTSILHHDLFHHLDMALAYNSTMATTNLKSEAFKRRSKALAQPITSADLPLLSAASTLLPDEIISQIVRHALGDVFCDLDLVEPSCDAKKPSFSCIDGMSRASRRFRAIGLSEWFRLFIVRHVDDWVWASRLKGMHTWVRYIICPPHTLEPPAPSNVLANFPFLRSASLSLSCDYQFNPFQPPTEIFPGAPIELDVMPGFAYRQPVTAFPSTMTSLAVRSTHGSETPLLRHLGEQCPDLRVLNLGKCTMFDCCTSRDIANSASETNGAYYGQIADGSECPFWGAFPFDHDIYFGGEGVEAYAEELASELRPLQKLEELSLGVYLTPHAALAEHRLAHYPWRHLENSQTAPTPGDMATFPDTPPPQATPSSSISSVPASPPMSATVTPPELAFPFSTSQMAPPPYVNPSLWSYDCSACRKAYSAPTSTAERTAGMILAGMLPRLKKIQWASFFESRDDCRFQRGTGTHEWRVIRDEAGTVLDLEQVF